jgi:hypothetical protein
LFSLRTFAELRDFLNKLAHVREAERERDDLEKLFYSQEEAATTRENEAYQRLRETNDMLERLRKQQAKMSTDYDAEEKRLDYDSDISVDYNLKGLE